MQVLGILARTRCDEVTDIGFAHAEQILEASRERGHIFIDLAAEMATKENLLRTINGLGSPSGSFLKLIVFYCHGNRNSPIDQNGQDFLTDETLSQLAGWGVYCIGCDVGQTLGHRLLAAGADFVIAFNAQMAMVLPHADEIYTGLNSGILRILREGISPSAATAHMRQVFLNSIDRVDETPDEYSILRKMYLRSHAKALVYHGSDRDRDPNKAKPSIRRASGSPKLVDEPMIKVHKKAASVIPDRSLIEELGKIKHGHKQALAYQQLVAKILHELFTPDLDEPHFEVSNESRSSRYDIVFGNIAERGFWHDIKMKHGNSIVIFDAKNKSELEPSDADQVLRYTSEWRGRVIFIVCRDRPTRSFLTRSSDLLKEKDVCLIVLSDKELEEMHALKSEGKNPNIVVQRLYIERIENA